MLFKGRLCFTFVEYFPHFLNPFISFQFSFIKYSLFSPAQIILSHLNSNYSLFLQCIQQLNVLLCSLYCFLGCYLSLLFNIPHAYILFSQLDYKLLEDKDLVSEMSNFPHKIKHILTDPLVIQLRDVDAIARKCGKEMRQLGW